eukprot:6294286-Ditylum_brightwellii.AAC.1
MHGMDIDVQSTISAFLFLPSKVDLVKLRKSFINVASFDIKKGNNYRLLHIEESSIGFSVYLEPTVSPFCISRTVVPPYTYVKASIEKETKDSRIPQTGFAHVIWREIIMTLGYTIYLVLIFGTLLPSYDLWMYGFGKPSSIWAAVPALASSLVLHTFVFMILLAVTERLMLPNSSELSKHPTSVYALYQTMAWNFQTYSLQRIFEFSKFSAAMRTIADLCHLASHQVVFNE